MNKFWCWMVSKDYGFYDIDYGSGSVGVIYYQHDSNGDSFEPTKQQLIGYMIEYLNSIYRKEMSQFYRITSGTIDKMYSNLKKEINKISLLKRK